MEEYVVEVQEEEETEREGVSKGGGGETGEAVEKEG